MPGTVYHIKTNTVPDITNSGYGVLPSDWNSVHAITLSLSGAEIFGAFGNNNRVSFGTNGFGQITANFGGISGTDLSGAFSNNSMATVSTNASGALEVSVNAVPAITLSAGGSSTSGNAVALLNGNGVSFGLAGPFITASVVPGSTVFSGPAIQVSGQPALTSGTVVWTGSNITLSQVGNVIQLSGNPPQTNYTFSNQNGISFGTNGSVVTASYNSNLLAISGVIGSTGAQNVLEGAGQVTLSQSNQSITIGVPLQTNFTLEASNGVSFGTNGSFVTASINAPAIQAGTVTYSAGPVVITGTNNVTVSASGSTISISGPTLTSLSFVNSNGVSFGVNGSTLTASISQSNQPAVAVAVFGNNPFTSGTAVFQAGNNITLSTGGQGITIVGPNPVTSNTLGISAGGNVAGTPSLISLGTLVLAGGNNITISQNVSSITIEAGVSGAAIGISGGTFSQPLSYLEFDNSNGVSFGLNGSTMTASVNTTQRTLSINQTNVTVNSTTGTGGTTLSFSNSAQTAYQFSNSNGVSFGTNGSTITASVAPAGITLSAGTTTGTITNLTLSNSNNVSFGLSNGVVTASASYTTQTNYVFSNSNGVSFGTNGSTVTASVVTSSPGIQVSAGASLVQSATQVIFSNSNNVNFGLSGSTITGSAIQQSITVSASGSSGAYAALTFSNSNSITFGNSQGTITATVSYPAQTYLSLFPAGNTSGNSTQYTISSGSGYIVGGNNVTISQTSNSLYINAGSATVAPITFSAGGSTSALGSVIFSNINNVSWGLSAGSIITASVQNNLPISISASNTSATTPLLYFSNGNGVSWSLNTANSYIQASINTNNNITIAGNGSTNTVNQIVFSNSNSVTFGLTGSTITATVSYPTQTSLSFSNLNGVTFGINGSTLTASVVPPAVAVTFSDSAHSSTLGTVNLGSQNGLTLYLTQSSIVGSYTVPTQTSATFSNSNNVSFGVNAGVVTATATFAQSVQPMSFSANNGTFTATELSLIQSTGNVLFSSATNSKLFAVAYESISAGANNGTVSYIIFSNSNNVSFGFDGASVITATATVSQSVQPDSWSVQNGTFSGTAITWGTQGNVTMSSSSSAGGTSVYGVANINLSAGTTSGNSASFVFSNSNGVSFGFNNGTVTASINSALQGILISAGTVSGTRSSLVFSNSNGVSFGLNGSTLTGSVSQSVQPLTVTVSGTNGSMTCSALSFSNSGNVQFKTDTNSGVDGYASLNFSAGTTSNNISAITFGNANAITFGLQTTNSAIGTITASYSQSVQPLTVSAANASFSVAAGALSFGTTGNVNFSTTANSIINAYASINVSAGAGTSNALSGLTFANSNGLTFGLSTGAAVGTITASYTVPTQSNQTIGVYLTGNTTLTSSGTMDARSVTLSMSTNVTAAYSNGVIILSANAGGAATQSFYATGTNTTIATSGTAANAWYFSAAGGILSAGVSSNTIYISGPGSTSFAPLSVGISTQGNTAGTTGFFTNNWQAVGGSNITLSQSTNTNGGTWSIIGGVPASQSVSAVGNLYLTTTSSTGGSTFIFSAAPQLSQLTLAPGMMEGAAPVSTNFGNGTMVFVPLVGMLPITATQLAMPMSVFTPAASASSATVTIAGAVGIYSLNASTAFSLITASSASQNFILTLTSSNSNSLVAGYKDLTFPLNLNYTGGDLWLGFVSTTSATGTGYASAYSFSNMALTQTLNSYSGVLGASAAGNQNAFLGFGTFATATSSLPASINTSAISGGNAWKVVVPFLKFRAI